MHSSHGWSIKSGVDGLTAVYAVASSCPLQLRFALRPQQLSEPVMQLLERRILARVLVDQATQHIAYKVSLDQGLYMEVVE
jgi:hypothetical protein